MEYRTMAHSSKRLTAITWRWWLSTLCWPLLVLSMQQSALHSMSSSEINCPWPANYVQRWVELLWNAAYRLYSCRVVKLSSPVVNYLILVGAVLLYVTVFFLVFSSDDVEVETVFCNVSLVTHKHVHVALGAGTNSLIIVLFGKYLPITNSKSE